MPSAAQAVAADELPADDADIIAQRLHGLTGDLSAVDAEGGDFRGDLSQASVVDLIQLLGMNRRSGALSVTTPVGGGEIRLDQGDIVDAVYRRLEGEKALYRLLGETDGAFAFLSGNMSAMRRISVPTSTLLMEGMRRVDEVKRKRTSLGSVQDALLALSPAAEDASEIQRRIAELLTVPHTVDEVLDEVPHGDLELLDELDLLLKAGAVRRIPRGAVRAELAEPDQMALLAALVSRLHAKGYAPAARVVVAAPPPRLAAFEHAVRRIADAVPPNESAPAAPVPHRVAMLRLGEGAELEVVGLPVLEAYAPLWAMTVPGAAAVIRLAGSQSQALDDLCSAREVRSLHVEELVSAFDEADPGQCAQLVRRVLEKISAA